MDVYIFDVCVYCMYSVCELYRILLCGSANSLFQGSVRGHVKGSIPQLISHSRVLVIKMLLDLN